MVENKVCKMCEEVLPIASFNKTKKKHDGSYYYAGSCKACTKVSKEKPVKKKASEQLKQYKELKEILDNLGDTPYEESIELYEFLIKLKKEASAKP